MWSVRFGSGRLNRPTPPPIPLFEGRSFRIKILGGFTSQIFGFKELAGKIFQTKNLAAALVRNRRPNHCRPAWTMLLWWQSSPVSRRAGHTSSLDESDLFLRRRAKKSVTGEQERRVIYCGKVSPALGSRGWALSCKTEISPSRFRCSHRTRKAGEPRVVQQEIFLLYKLG